MKIHTGESDVKAEKYLAKVRIYHDQLGRIEKGQEFEATPVQMGSIASFATKIEPEKPTVKKASKVADGD